VKKTGVLIGIGATALMAGVASAANYGYGSGPEYSGMYLGASVGELIYNEDGINTLNPTIALFRVGQQFSPYLAIEGRVGTGINGASSYGFHIDPQVLYAGYAKGILPLTPWVSGYAIAGLAGVEMHRNYPDFNSNDVGVSFGFGAEFNLAPSASLNVEWAHLTNGTNAGYDFTADQLTFGVNWRL
jgi:hypothetical protein